VKVDDEIRKSFETIVHIKTQIEEAKRIEELLKNQINEKEESCCKLEAEIVDLRKKVENSNKFLNSSLILDEILESQRSPYDKSGLGYIGEDTHAEANTSKTHEVNTSKKEDNVAKQLLTGENDRPSTGRVEPVRGCLNNPSRLVWTTLTSLTAPLAALRSRKETKEKVDLS
jgi:hypothetical protein